MNFRHMLEANKLEEALLKRGGALLVARDMELSGGGVVGTPLLPRHPRPKKPTAARWFCALWS